MSTMSWYNIEQYFTGLKLTRRIALFFTAITVLMALAAPQAALLAQDDDDDNGKIKIIRRGLSEADDDDDDEDDDETFSLYSSDADSQRFLHSFEFAGRIQTRYLWYGSTGVRDKNDRAERLFRKIPVNDVNDGPYTEFKLRRVRLGIEGQINEKWGYEFDMKLEQFIAPYETETARVLVNKDGTYVTDEVTVIDEAEGSITDAYLQYKHADWLTVIMGSTEIPYSREGELPSFRLVSVERAVSTNELAARRDIGLQFRGDLLSDRLHYGFGIFNGSPDPSDAGNGAGTLDDGSKNKSPVFGGRIAYDPLGPYYSGRSMFTDELLVSVGLGGQYQAERDAMMNPYRMQVENFWGMTVDAAVNGFGFNLEGAFYMVGAQYPAERIFTQPDGTQVKDDGHHYYGFYAQLSYMYERFLQPWVKFDQLQDNGFSKDNTNQKLSQITSVIYDEVTYGTIASGKAADLSTARFLSFGVNLYLVRPHHVKVSTIYSMGLNKGADINRLEYTDLGTKDDWGGVQVQMQF